MLVGIKIRPQIVLARVFHLQESLLRHYISIVMIELGTDSLLGLLVGFLWAAKTAQRSFAGHELVLRHQSRGDCVDEPADCDDFVFEPEECHRTRPLPGLGSTRHALRTIFARGYASTWGMS